MQHPNDIPVYRNRDLLDRRIRLHCSQVLVVLSLDRQCIQNFVQVILTEEVLVVLLPQEFRLNPLIASEPYL